MPRLPLNLLRLVAMLMVALALTVPLKPEKVDALPSQLPSHFAFGVSAGQGDTWMPQTGIPFDYRMQYLAGGVNTGNGWETWNSNGTFALNYANESAQHGYIAVFPYYELLQSSGSCVSCGENQKDIGNLNNAGLMSAYYANFALLMKRLGPGTYDGIQGFGKTALVNVEPDFSGGYAMQAANNNGVCFGFCTAQGNDPSFLKASVANSGFAEVAGFSNTYAGYVQALAHLRDLYAPNVVLGLDVSPWATGNDIGLDSNPSTNMATLGQQVGTFLSKTGPHDLLFSNPLDRDAGQYKAVFGQNRWWDRLNVSLPNFHRWEQYLQAVVGADGGRSMLLWQVPVGNQYFDTENNTNGHYQDNRPEYIFGHIPELIQSGVVGAIFASGNGGNTTYTDASRDGVTNPASFCATDGLSSGQMCNSHTSSVSDDDGGFIRMSAQAYYHNPVGLGGGTPPTWTPTATSTSGSTTPSATSTTTSTPTATATRRPRNRSTSTPVPTATSTPTSASGTLAFNTGASVVPASVARGASDTITITARSASASLALVDVEVYSGAGTKVFQQWWDDQSFTAGQTRTYSATWSVPSTLAPGNYTVTLGIFSTGWGSLYNWNGNATTITIV